MLDRLSKKLLDFLIEQDVETYYVCAFSEAFSNSANITIDELAKKTKYTYRAASCLCALLISQRILRVSKNYQWSKCRFSFIACWI